MEIRITPWNPMTKSLVRGPFAFLLGMPNAKNAGTAL